MRIQDLEGIIKKPLPAREVVRQIPRVLRVRDAAIRPGFLMDREL